MAAIVKCAIKLSLKVLLYGFVLIPLCFLCVRSFFSVCSFLRNWFQSLGWGPESVSFSEKSRMF